MNIDKSNLATWMLLLGVLFWGATFSFIKEAMDFIDVYSFISVRFIIATILLSLIFCKKLSKLDISILKIGLLLGTVLAAGFVFQTIGIKHTTASNAGFITGLVVVIIPIYVGLLDKKLPKYNQILAIVSALIGLGLLTLKSGFSINIGDAWVLLSALFFAAHLVMVARLVKKIDASLFAIIQLLTIGIIIGIMGLFFNKEIIISSNFIVWRAILFCAIFASAYMYTTQAYLQRYITELKAAIIFSFEPLFAAIIAYLYLNEIFTINVIVGGLLIFFGMILSDLKIKSKVTFTESS